MTTHAYIQLPAKPSALIDLALDDLEWVEGNPKYRVAMGFFWHVPNGKVCLVCLAGAVMAHTLKAPMRAIMPSESCDTTTCDRLISLDWFRTGQVGEGLARTGLTSRLPDRTIRSYYDDPTGFKADLRRLARDLAAEGL